MKLNKILITLTVLFYNGLLYAQPFSSADTMVYLDIPDRSPDAIEGYAFADQITPKSLNNREIAVVEQILSGNVPSFARKMRLLKVNKIIDSQDYELIFFSVCDYMAIGSDEDYLYMPMTPATAQYLANRLNCTLPTKKMVDIIYAGTGLKLYPQPIPWSPEMVTVPVFRQHTDSVKKQIADIGYNRSADSLVGGHKKDIIISNKIYSSGKDCVVIYGWHYSVGNPIQPVYNGHSATYADYSHGVRLVSNIAYLNGDSVLISDILKDSKLSVLLSHEGVISKPYYPESDIFTSVKSQSNVLPKKFELYQNYPNPFNPHTTIKYFLQQPSRVNLSVYNQSGQSVSVLVDDSQQAGEHITSFNGSELSSGIYYYKISAGNFKQTRKMVIVR